MCGCDTCNNCNHSFGTPKKVSKRVPVIAVVMSNGIRHEEGIVGHKTEIHWQMKCRKCGTTRKLKEV